MKVSTLLLTIALVCFLAVFSSATKDDVFQPVPLIMWGNNIQSIQNLETTGENKLQEIVTETINEICQQNEIVVIFIEPKLRTEQLWETHAFKTLSEKVNSGATVYPYVAAELGISNAVVKSVKPISSRVTLAKNSLARGELAELNRISIDSLPSFLETSDVLSNGVTDVVIVYFDEAEGSDEELLAAYAAHDDLAGSIIDIVNAKTSGKFAAMFTANKPYLTEVTRIPKVRRMVRDLDDNSTGSGSDSRTDPYGPYNPIYTTYFPPFILEVYITGGVMLIILFIGVCCTCNLQTPGRFENPQKVKKEL